MKNHRKSICKNKIIVFVFTIMFTSFILSSLNYHSLAKYQDDSLFPIGKDYGNLDPYADDLLPSYSLFYTNGENALGEPDGLNAQIFTVYSAGYITLDMGKYEEILNGTGDDFSVISSSGNYSCWVANNLGSTFTLLGDSSGNSSFDLEPHNFASVRYVRIQYWGGGTVQLDAIEATYHNVPEEDNENPQITGPEDFWIWDDQTSYNITWTVSDLTPLKYSISVNQEEIEVGDWEDEIISFTHIWTVKELQNVTLILYDAYGNIGVDSVIIEIRDSPAETTGNNFIIIASCTILTVAVISILRNCKHKKN